MPELGKKFCSIKMTWVKVILLAVLSAVITAVCLIVPALANTALADMGTYFEVWFLYAMLIIMNCKSWKEASLKTFVFFLISQPLIYLLQVPFSWLGWGIFQYYPRWFVLTLLTIPGAAIAFLVKKQNWLSVAVLSVANVYLCFMGTQYVKWVINPGTKHVLSAIFCFGLAAFFSFGLLEKKKHKIAACVVMLVVTIASVFLEF